MATPKKKGWKARAAGMIPGGGLVAGIFSFLWTILRSKWFWYLAVVGTVLFSAFTLAIMLTAPEAPPPSINGLPQPPPPESWGAWFVRGLSMIILVLITAFLVRLAYRDCITAPPAPDKNTPAPPPYFDWVKARKNSVLILAFAIPVFNIFLGALATGTWIWWSSHFTLFVFSNLGVIVAGHFYDKGNKLNQGVAFLILFLILVGFFGALASDVRKKATDAYGRASLGLGGFSRPSSPFSGFGQPDLLQLNPKEFEARVEAIGKVPFEERRVLATIFGCNPESEEFKPDEKTGEIPALATYRSKGARAFGQACVDKLVRARQTFTLAVVEATSEEWSDPVEIPSAFSYQYTTHPSEEKGGYKTMAIGTEGQTKEITTEKGTIPFPVDKIRFQSVRDRTVRVTVIFHPKGAGPR